MGREGGGAGKSLGDLLSHEGEEVTEVLEGGHGRWGGIPGGEEVEDEGVPELLRRRDAREGGKPFGRRAKGHRLGCPDVLADGLWRRDDQSLFLATRTALK